MARLSRPWREIRRGDDDPDRRVRTEEIKAAMVEAMDLAELREGLELRQADVAARMGVEQPQVSRLERRDDWYLSTLRGYITALGGELSLVAEFPDGTTVRVEPRHQRIANHNSNSAIGPSMRGMQVR
jgi:hypothetical protein